MSNNIEFSVKTSELSEVLNAAFTVAPVRGDLKIIETVKISLLNGLLYIETTDLQINLKVTLNPVTYNGDMSFCFPMKIRDIIDLCETDTVNFKIDVAKKTAHIQSGDKEAKLNLFDIFDFPVMDSGNKKFETVKIGVADLYRSLALTEFAASKDTDKPILTGICIVVKLNEVHFVATDSIVVAYSKATAESLVDTTTTVPASIFLVAAKILNNLSSNKTVSMKIFQDYVFIESDNVQIKVLSLSGNYPVAGITNLFKMSQNSFLEIDTAEFLSACKFVSQTKDELDLIEFDLVMVDTVPTVFVSSQNESGETIQKLPCDFVGSDTSDCYKSHLIEKILSVTKGFGYKTVTVQTPGKRKPLFITPDNDGKSVAVDFVLFPFAKDTRRSTS